MKYLIEYNGKKVVRHGNDAREAFEKYANKPVFGQSRVFLNWRLLQYDADTLGEKWAQFRADDKVVTVSVL